MCRKNSSQYSHNFVAREEEDDEELYTEDLDGSAYSSHERLPLLTDHDFVNATEDVRDANVEIPTKMGKAKDKSVTKSKSVLF